jgi:hypothetical protein
MRAADSGPSPQIRCRNDAPSGVGRYSAVLGPGLLATVVAAFLVLKCFALLPHINDDGLYFYAATRVAAGAVPYRNFFFSHPPLHLYPTALVFAVFGYRWWLGKSVVFALAAIQALAVYLTVRRLLRDQTRPPAGEAAAVLAGLLLLTSETFLVVSSDDTGLVQSSAWLTVAIALLAYGRPRWSGVFAGTAAMTSLQTYPLVGVVGWAAFRFLPRRAAWELVLAAAAVILIVHLAAVALAGWSFVDQVYSFHLAKLEVPGEGARELRQLFTHNAPLLITAAAAAVGLGASEGRPRAVAQIFAAAIGTFLVAMATRPRVFYWYFTPALAPAAVLAGLGIGASLDALWPGVSFGPPGSRPIWRWLSIATVAVILLPARNASLGSLKPPHGAGSDYGRLVAYRWHVAPCLGRLNDLLRRLSWHGGQRRGPDDWHPPLTEYLWRESSWLDSLPRMVSAIQLQARLNPRVTLFGDYATVPLLALEAGVPVTGDFMDTTGQRFGARFATFEQVRRLLDAAPEALVLLRTGGSGVNALPAMRQYLAAAYTPLEALRRRTEVEHILYRRRSASWGSP